MRYALEEPGTFFAEAIRSVRLAVQRTLRLQPIKIVLVTSALDGEGKTTLRREPCAVTRNPWDQDSSD